MQWKLFFNYTAFKHLKHKATFQCYIFEYVYDIMSRVKGKQDRTVKKLEEELYGDISNHGGVAIGLIDEEFRGITGLVANRVASNLKKPTLLLRKKQGDSELSGSARGYTRVLDDFKTWMGNAVDSLIDFDSIIQKIKGSFWSNSTPTPPQAEIKDNSKKRN